MVQAFVLRAGGLALSVVMLSLAARVLLPEKFGQYALVMSIVMSLSIPVTTGFRQLVMREVASGMAQDDLFRARSVWIWSLRTAMLIAAVGALGLFTFLVWSDAPPSALWPYAMGGIILLITPFGRIFSGVLHGQGRTGSSQIVEVVTRPLIASSLLFMVFVSVEPGTASVTLALGIIAIAVLVEGGVGAMLLGRGEFAEARASRRTIQPSDRKRLWLGAASFGAIGGIQIINANLDILMVGALLGTTEAGLYRTATSLASITSFGLVVVNLVIVPKIVALHSSGDRDALQNLLFRSASLISLLALVGALVLWLGGEVLLGWIFGQAYLDAYWALAILGLGQFFNAFFGVSAHCLNMTGHEKISLVGVSIGAVSNVGLNVVLIPIYGIEGAAIATAVSLFTWNLILTLMLRRKTGLNGTIIQMTPRRG